MPCLSQFGYSQCMDANCQVARKGNTIPAFTTVHFFITNVTNGRNRPFPGGLHRITGCATTTPSGDTLPSAMCRRRRTSNAHVRTLTHDLGLATVKSQIAPASRERDRKALCRSCALFLRMVSFVCPIGGEGKGCFLGPSPFPWASLTDHQEPEGS